MIANRSQSTIDQSVNLPDYFSCRNCQAYRYPIDNCDEFQAKGRCAKAMLNQALQSGSIQIVLHLPTGVNDGT